MQQRRRCSNRTSSWFWSSHALARDAPSSLESNLMAAGLAAAAPAPAPAAIPLIQQRAFKPNGSPPPFDIEAERDTFLIWEERWNIFLNLSTIDEALRRSPAPGIQDQPIEVLFFLPQHCKLYCQQDSQQHNSQTTQLSSTSSTNAVMPEETDMYGDTNSRYYTSYRTRRPTTGSVAFATSAENAISDKIAAQTASPRAF